MRDPRALAWLLNWYRQSELEGALLLGRMVRHTDDPTVLAELTRHAADEARHAWLWQRTIAQLQLAPVRIYRSYQSFYATEGITPQRLAEVLALTHVFEHRVDREFAEQLGDPQLPEAVHRTFRAMLRDEQRHLGWIATWLRERSELQPLVARYTEVDAHVASTLRPFRDCLWNVSGLGEELPRSMCNVPRAECDSHVQGATCNVAYGT
jgi:rubrerythrin